MQCETTRLTGRLLRSGQPVSGEAVDLVDQVSSATLRTYVTGPDGAWFFDLVESGSYLVRPQGAGYDPPDARFVVNVPGIDFEAI